MKIRPNKSIVRIQKSLVSLLDDMPFEDIQVKDIVNEADLARATFYLHFSSKEEVLIDYIDTMFEHFFAQVEEAFSRTETLDESVAVKVFEVFKEEAKFSSVLLQDSVQPILLKRFKGYLSRIVGHVARLDQGFDVESEHLGYLVDYWAGGSLLLITRWVSNDYQPDVDAMARLFTKLTISGMKALLPEHKG